MLFSLREMGEEYDIIQLGFLDYKGYLNKGA